MATQPTANALPHSFPPLQDKDLAYWKVDLGEISSRAEQLGMRVVRTPAVDFSPHSLRDTLPRGEHTLPPSAGVPAAAAWWGCNFSLLLLLLLPPAEIPCCSRWSALPSFALPYSGARDGGGARCRRQGLRALHGGELGLS